MYYLADLDGASFYEIPLWIGARYYIGDRSGLSVGGDLAINHYIASADDGFGGSSSSSNTEIGVNLVASRDLGKLRIEAGVYVGDISNTGNATMIGSSIGTTF